MRWLQVRAWEIAAAIVLAAIYVAVLWALPKHVFFHPDEGGKFLQMASTQWDGGIRTTLRYGAQARDPELRFYPAQCAGNRVYPKVSDGVLHFQWPVWFPLLVSPFYAQWGTTGLYIVPIVCGWLSALLAAPWVRPHSRALAACTVLLVGLATPVAYYSFSFLEHTLATAVAMIGLWALCRHRHSGVAAACGFFALLLASALRVEMIIFALAAGLGWLVARLRTTPSVASWRDVLVRREMWLVLVALVVLIGATISLLTTRHAAELDGIPKMISATYHKRGFVFESLRNILINSRGFGAVQVTTGAETIALFALIACLVAPFFSKYRWEGVVLLIALALLVEVSFVITLLSQAYVARQGLFTVAPFLVLAVYALRHAWQARDAGLLCLAVTGVAYLLGSLALLFTTRVGYSGDYLIGLEGTMRYVLALYPVWAALSVVGLHVYRNSDRPALIRSTLTLLILMSIAMSVTYQGRGLLALERSRQTFARWFAQLPTDRPLVTSEWWLGAALAPYFIEHEMYCVASASSLPEWTTFAQAHGIERFTFAVRRDREAGMSAAAGLPLKVYSDREVDGLQLTDVQLTSPETSP